MCVVVRISSSRVLGVNPDSSCYPQARLGLQEIPRITSERTKEVAGRHSGRMSACVANKWEGY